MYESIWLQNRGHVLLGHLGVIGFERIKKNMERWWTLER